MLGILTETLYN